MAKTTIKRKINSKKKKRFTLLDLAGTIKGGKKSNPKEIDKLVYGI